MSAHMIYYHDDICETCGDMRARCTGDTCDDGERDSCDECGESFNANESGCDDHCASCCDCDEGETK